MISWPKPSVWLKAYPDLTVLVVLTAGLDRPLSNIWLDLTSLSWRRTLSVRLGLSTTFPLLMTIHGTTTTTVVRTQLSQKMGSVRAVVSDPQAGEGPEARGSQLRDREKQR